MPQEAADGLIFECEPQSSIKKREFREFMSLHDDLLILAKELANRNPTAPVEGDLRRAVSTAYYALFHLLVHEATTRVVGPPALRPRVARSFDHRIMRVVCHEYSKLKPNASGQLLGAAGEVVPPGIQQIAEKFVELQKARFDADYDTTTPPTQIEARSHALSVELAFANRAAVQADPATDAFLAELLCRGIPKR